MMKNYTVKKVLSRLGVYVFMIFMALMFISPLIFAIVSSLKDNRSIFRAPFSLPETPLWQNYVTAWTTGKMGSYFLNSVFISFSTIILLGLVASMAAFALSKMQLKMNKFLGTFFLLGMMIPLHTVLIPVAFLVGNLGLTNNLFALIFIYVAFSLPFSISVLTVFMNTINNSLLEAAVIDGAGFFQIYKNVILPMSVPALSTISIFNFLSSWNDILFPLIIINDNRLKPISLGLLNFHGERGSDYGPMMAAIVITSIIPIILYVLFQEKVESEIAAGAVKG